VGGGWGWVGSGSWGSVEEEEEEWVLELCHVVIGGDGREVADHGLGMDDMAPMIGSKVPIIVGRKVADHSTREGKLFKICPYSSRLRGPLLRHCMLWRYYKGFSNLA
jgi:hypothetical protein